MCLSFKLAKTKRNSMHSRSLRNMVRPISLIVDTRTSTERPPATFIKEFLFLRSTWTPRRNTRHKMAPEGWTKRFLEIFCKLRTAAWWVPKRISNQLSRVTRPCLLPVKTFSKCHIMRVRARYNWVLMICFEILISLFIQHIYICFYINSKKFSYLVYFVFFVFFS